jgi:hypothetical protein
MKPKTYIPIWLLMVCLGGLGQAGSKKLAAQPPADLATLSLELPDTIQIGDFFRVRLVLSNAGSTPLNGPVFLNFSSTDDLDTDINLVLPLLQTGKPSARLASGDSIVLERDVLALPGLLSEERDNIVIIWPSQPMGDSNPDNDRQAVVTFVKSDASLRQAEQQPEPGSKRSGAASRAGYADLAEASAWSAMLDALEDGGQKLTVPAYPNPAREKVTLPGLMPGKYRLCSFEALQCRDSEHSAGNTLDVRDWPAGQYILLQGDQQWKILIP